ncbi:Rhs element Vgr protein, partial [Capnocytophaga sp. 051621]
FSYISYDVETGNTEQKTTQEVHLQDKINPFQYAAIKASEKVFTKKPTIPYNAISEQFRGDYLKDVVRREKESREQLMQVRGKSRNPHLRIGGFIKLKDINDKPMESYRIIDIKHHQSGYDYENEFIAIPDVYIAYYYDEQALPRAEQQVARVTDNNDPKGLGRVRVQFIWQEKHQTKTPWIRV